ncbi:MAG: Hsp20/alpha crystallin family protein [Thermodesulfobacteriota bacterium]
MRYGLRLWEPFNVLRGFNEGFASGFDADSDNEVSRWSPKVDIVEKDNSYIVRAEVPGVSREDIDIDLKDNNLVIKGEKKFEKKDEKDNYVRVESSYGSFQRSFYIDEKVDKNNISAKYKDGILEVTLPKKEEAAPKKIEVKVN